MLLLSPTPRKYRGDHMKPTDGNTEKLDRSEPESGDNLRRAGRELLARTRAVARQITNRVRKALGEKCSETPPPDPNENTPPLA
jgi:hypothetical protein